MLFQFSIVAVLAACAAAQNDTVTEFFNISSVDLSTRSSWCIGQRSVCSTLCSGSTNMNTCTNADLTFTCLCASNNSVPGLQYYLNTIPTQKCTSAYGSCVQDHPNDLTGITACATDINSTCGTIDSTKSSIGSSSSSSSAAASSTSASSTSSQSASSTTASSTSTPSTKANAAAAVYVGTAQQYGLGALAAGAIAAFGFML